MKDENQYSNLQSDLSLHEEFDPLEDLEPDEDEESAEIEGFLGTAETAAAPPIITDDRPAEVRITELLTRMAPRRKILISTITQCAEPKPVTEVNAFIDSLQEDNYSVYSAATLCGLLEEAGALRRVGADGESLDDEEVEPEVVVIDGVEYLQAQDPIEVFWVATDEALAVAAADKPLERLQELFEKDSRYKPLYKRILTLCSAENGATTPQINEAIDHDPLVQKPRLYAPHFIDKLEKCDALTWKKAWITSEIGQAGLALLADVEDSEETTETEEA